MIDSGRGCAERASPFVAWAWALAATVSLTACAGEHAEPTPQPLAKSAQVQRLREGTLARMVGNGHVGVPAPRGIDRPPPRPMVAGRSPAPLRFEAPPPSHAEGRDLWHPPAPQVRAPFGAQVLAAPRIVSVHYAADPNQAAVADFESRIGASAFWAPLAEYGVGPATALSPVVRPEAPPAEISDQEIGAWLVAQLGDPSSPLPPFDPSNVYALHFPATTTVTLQGGAWRSCQQFGAYHSSAALPSGQRVAYAVLPSCNGYLGFSGLDAITNASSHELVEAATDPFGYGFNDPDWEGSGWSYAFEGGPGGELADFCEFQPDVSVTDPELGHLVQRYWSNAAAAAWHDPCAPAPARPYFNARPILGGTTAGPFQWTKGVAIPPGGRATIPLELFADAKIGAWSLSASEESNPHLQGDPWHQLSFEFDETTGRAGDVRYLTVKRAPRPDGAPLGALPFAVISTQGSVRNVWWIVVGQ